MASGAAQAVKGPTDWQEVEPSDWQEVTQAPAPSAPAPPQPSLLQRGLKMAGDVYTGATQGVESTLGGLGNLITRPFVSPEFAAGQKSYLHAVSTPQNTSQAIGKGIEQAGEFMLPGGAEEKGAAKLAEFAPKLAPLFRAGTAAAGAAAVNTAQGGSPLTGALVGAGGSIIGQGLKAAAPIIAETGLALPKAARAFGKTPGKALLEETKGIRPDTIAASARERMGQLTPELEQAADAASVQPNAAKGLLTSGTEQIPLPNAPDVGGRLSKPITLMQTDRPMPRQLPISTRTTPMSSHADIFPNQLPSGTTGIPSVAPTPASGMGAGEYIGQIPGERGGAGQSNGVLLRGAPAGTGPIPSMLPNRSASLGPARSVIGNAMSSAESQNAEGLHGQLGQMQDFLGKRFGSGEEIPSNVTPRELLDLKRGLSEEHLRWNPETHNRALSVGRQAYGALDQELDRTVPEAAGLNQRLSSLIPVAQRAESVSRGAPALQRAAQRFGAHTGALTMGGIGAAGGYKEGGVPGAIAGGLTGIVTPELVASPEGQIALARTLYKMNGLTPLVGAGLQADRKKETK